MLLFELEEDVEGMQSTIYHLQNQLKEAKDALQKYQTKEENKVESGNNAKLADQVNSKDELSGDKKSNDERPNEPAEGELTTVETNCESNDVNSLNNCGTEKSDALKVSTESTDETKASNGSEEKLENLNQENSNKESSNETNSDQEPSKQEHSDQKNSNQENHENLVKPVDAVKNGEQKVEERNSLERKRSLDDALEEVNASGNSDCGIDSIIKKHRKLEQEKTQQD